ncbi:MAG: PAS domain S-box protein [Bacteroidales bacterium]|nr:PAS domain S-box protein [Bacteroidales bacterium]
MKKTTLRTQLFKRLIVLLLLMSLIAVSGIIVTAVLKRTSNKIVFEYLELNAVQELRLAFNKTFIPAYNYLIYHEPAELLHFRSRLDSTHRHLDYCKTILSKTHSKELLETFENHLAYFENMVLNTENTDFDIIKNRKLIPILDDLIDSSTQMIEQIIFETKQEIDECIALNTTAVTHSSVTIILLSCSVILIGFIIGSLFVRKIVQPLRNLVSFTREVADGNLDVIAGTSSRNELEDLAAAFNHMVDNLRLTTVSMDLFNNILTSMQELVVVVDVDGRIVLVNNAASRLLGYNDDELPGKPVDLLFEKSGAYSRDDVLKLTSLKCIENEYVTKTGQKIPILLSYADLRNKMAELTGFIMVAADITEIRAAERNLEFIRRKTMIDLNDVQEKERLRIAKDLHDGLGQMLTGISYYVENNFSEKAEPGSELSEHIDNIQNQIDAAIKESKIIAYDLIPMQLKDFGLSAAIAVMVDRLNARQKTKFVFSEFNIHSRLDEKLEKALYRIVQEATNNVVKHAQAELAQVQLIKHDNSISLIVVDDGKGFNAEGISHGYNNKGLGLTSIHERVASFNGLLNITSKPGAGTEILIEIYDE